jgi:NADPH2:quinone reductase
MAEDMLRAIKRGHLMIEEPKAFSLAAAAQVHAALESRRTAGSMVLIP